jgi:hypothetical protein
MLSTASLPSLQLLLLLPPLLLTLLHAASSHRRFCHQLLMRKHCTLLSSACIRVAVLVVDESEAQVWALAIKEGGVTIKVDVSNAFNTLQRNSIAQALFGNEDLKSLLRLIEWVMVKEARSLCTRTARARRR